MGGELLSIYYFDQAAAVGAQPASDSRVMAARLRLGQNVLMGSDVAIGETYARPVGIRLQTNINDVIEARRIFDRLAVGGEVEMPFEQTYWASGFGLCRDRFGVPWMINCDRED